MTIEVKVIADSIGYGYQYKNSGNFNNLFGYDESARLTTLQLRYPRFIHSEFMTHRVFSRNASSSRAIPVAKLIEDIIQDPAIPLHWGKNQPGMQAREEHNDFVNIGNPGIPVPVLREYAWLAARDEAVKIATAFSNAGYHKQIVNRILEPFSHINVVVTSNQWKNFFELRKHEDAQPEIRVLAEKIYEAMAESTPSIIRNGEWHLPYIRAEDKDEAWNRCKEDFGVSTFDKMNRMLAEISAARCARTSYLTHDGNVPSFEKDKELFDKLLNSEPLHASPAEHQAVYRTKNKSQHNYYHSNFAGNDYIQFRKIIEQEKYNNFS